MRGLLQILHTRPKRWGGSAALSASLIVSGYVMAVALRSDAGRWLAWFSLLPLFVAIRTCRPRVSLLCGALWGLSLCLFSTAGPAEAVSAGPRSLILLVCIPAIYSFLGSSLTRWIGFSPFVLGVAWMGAELALKPLGARYGLLAGTQGDGALMQCVGGGLGYVLVAFIVAYVNAMLVSALAAPRRRIPRPAYRVASGKVETRLIPQTLSCFASFPVRLTQPRGPPFQPVAISW